MNIPLTIENFDYTLKSIYDSIQDLNIIVQMNNFKQECKLIQELHSLLLSRKQQEYKEPSSTTAPAGFRRSTQIKNRKHTLPTSKTSSSSFLGTIVEEEKKEHNPKGLKGEDYLIYLVEQQSLLEYQLQETKEEDKKQELIKEIDKLKQKTLQLDSPFHFNNSAPSPPEASIKKQEEHPNFILLNNHFTSPLEQEKKEKEEKKEHTPTENVSWQDVVPALRVQQLIHEEESHIKYLEESIKELEKHEEKEAEEANNNLLKLNRRLLEESFKKLDNLLERKLKLYELEATRKDLMEQLESLTKQYKQFEKRRRHLKLDLEQVEIQIRLFQ